MSKPDLVPTYLPHQATSEKPAFYLPRAEARQMKREGKGYFLSQGRAFRLASSRPDDWEALARAGTASAMSRRAFSLQQCLIMCSDKGEPSPRSKVGPNREAAALLVRLLCEFYRRASLEGNREEMKNIAELIREISQAAVTREHGR